MGAISLLCNEYMNIVYVNVSHTSDSQQGVRVPCGYSESTFTFVKPIKQKLGL